MNTPAEITGRRRMLKGIAGGVLLPAAAPVLAQIPTVRPPLLELSSAIKGILNGAMVTEQRARVKVARCPARCRLHPNCGWLGRLYEVPRKPRRAAPC